MRHAQLKAFHAVARHGGFSKAAERLGLTQPAVSEHIRNLEEVYGVTLIDRGPSGIVLTDLGRKLYAIAERQFEVEAEAVQLLSRARRLEEGQLVLGADAAVHVLPLVARFREAYPRIAIRIEAGNSTELLARLKAFRIDAVVVAQAPADPGLSTLRMRSNRLVALVPSCHALAGSGSIGFADFAALPLILREEGSVTRRLVVEEMHRRGQSPRIVLEIETREAAREAVAQGLGVTVVSEAEAVPDPRIAALAFANWPAEMEEWLVVLKARQSLQLIQAVWRLAEGTSRGRIEEGSIATPLGL